MSLLCNLIYHGDYVKITLCSFSKCVHLKKIDNVEANKTVNVPGKNGVDSQLGAH